VIPNENITAATFKAALDDLGQSVVGTHAHWSVANWASTTSEDPAAAARTAAPIKGSTPQAPAARPAAGTPATTQTQTAKPLQSAVNDSKFGAVPKK
jgi:hypothetical protein